VKTQAMNMGVSKTGNSIFDIYFNSSEHKINIKGQVVFTHQNHFLRGKSKAFCLTELRAD